ncbi:hypothetical protein [Paenarthrobacter nitroguajacolicus]|uniref:hypothetical protein n=1 Tax=Paenarthrobacter nitroguajacolicus TaxID=211146 RepID=UPI00285FFB0E|nr:hypothetical protein [Paenarthrobacter nitroguajacolicus]MDR6639386.1 hypothetical protein [Paenarthrobacter nitroguajacolicus]
MKKIAQSTVAALVLILGCSSLLAAAVGRTATAAEDHERGDVPGWVMITLMSAVLVAGLLALAAPALNDLFNQAIHQVAK